MTVSRIIRVHGAYTFAVVMSVVIRTRHVFILDR